MKRQYSVGIITDNGNQIKYVTNTDYAARMAAWEDGAAAKVFTQACARDIAEGLFLNGYLALVLEVPAGVQLANEMKTN